MRKFDTSVQELKYKVLKSVAKKADEGNLRQGVLDIPSEIIDGDTATMRCCIYKERAIVQERVKLALGGDKSNPNVVEVLNIACDECPVNRFEVGSACRGCIAHRCVNACPRDAITIVNQKAVIDNDKCIECGRCQKACPYSAIIKSVRPCEQACKVNAISMDERKKAKINNDDCIACGACVYQCPFGAIMDKSYIVDVINLLKESDHNKKFRVYAVVAPSIASQFSYAKIGQIITGIKEYGFHDAVEAALGADMVAYKEAGELAEKGFLTSSCCPAFVEYVEKFHPSMKEHISHNVSPMAQIAIYIKRADPTAKVVFIGPCIAKKKEILRDKVKGVIDYVLTFEELQALFDSRDMEIGNLPETEMDNASYFGRVFARSGGLAVAVEEALKEHNITEQQFAYKPISCNGLDECKVALLKAKKGVLQENFIEGMACEGGCIGGAACLTHEPKDKNEVDKYGALAKEKSILEAVNVLKFIK